MVKTEIYDRCYIKDEKIEKIGNIRHGFTTAKGGFSTGRIKGLNLGFRVGDDKESVIRNYRAAAADLELTYENMVLARQTHTDNIRVVTKADCGKGLTRESDIFDTDGLITNEKNIPMVIFSADCIPVLLAAKDGNAVGAVHAGWRGTEKKIPKKAVRLMEKNYGVRPENIIAAIGPGIGPCCFEVGEEVAAQFDERFVIPKGGGKFYVDLWQANVASLLEAGVAKENISVAKICNKCREDMFYSYRAHREKTGRQGAIIEIAR